MSQFYDLASLVVIPSGYKASTIYAQKPLTTDGQLSFTRASTATRVNASGLIEAVASNVPRLDYLGSSCPRLLLEPQRTNLALYSEQFDNAAWTKGALTVSANNATSPDGYVSADKLVENTSNSTHRIFNNSSVTVSSTNPTTYSVFLKAAGRTRAFVRDNDIVGAEFNLSTGVVVATEGTATATITNYGSGWYRCTITRVSSTTNGRIIVYTGNGTSDTYTGDGTSGVLVWGAQLEAGSYATSYIPTTAASVTRVADAASKTGISSLIGQTEGVLFVDFVVNGKESPAANILNSEKNTMAAFFMGILLNNTVDVGLYSSTSAVARITGGSVIVGQRAKIAYAYKSGSSALYLNGTLIGTSSDTFTLPATLDDIFLNDPTTYFNYQENVSFNEALLFKTRLTNAQLAELTTL